MRYMIVILIVIALALGWWLYTAKAKPAGTVKPQDPAKFIAHIVKKGEFIDKIVESGELAALNSVTIAPVIKGEMLKITSIIDEGVMVREGAPLVRFDQEPFIRELEKNQKELDKLYNDKKVAEETIKLQEVKNSETIEQEKQKVKKAEMELTNLEQGDGPLQIKEMKMQMDNFKLEMEKAKIDRDNLKSLLASDFVTVHEVDKAEMNFQKAEKNYDYWQDKYVSFKDFTLPQKIQDARENITFAKENLSKARESARYTLSVRHAAVEQIKAEIENKKNTIENISANMEKTELRAPIPGLVIYNMITIDGTRRKPRVGDAVWEHMPLISLPNIKTMVVMSKVREMDIKKIYTDQPVKVLIDAFPDKTWKGRIKSIGTLAKQDESTVQKYFDITVVIDGTNDILRPDMSARIELIIREKKDVITVPSDLIISENGGSYVFVTKDNQKTKRTVKTGDQNYSVTEILSGLDVGEEIILQ